jgi:AbrB family looped-hinge helix DNA binding protein
MHKITVTQKGQIVIPAEIRKKLNIKKGTKLLIKEEGNNILMIPDNKMHISHMRGALKSKESMIEYLLNERAAEYAKLEREWKK